MTVRTGREKFKNDQRLRDSQDLNLAQNVRIESDIIYQRIDRTVGEGGVPETEEVEESALGLGIEALLTTRVIHIPVA